MPRRTETKRRVIAGAKWALREETGVNVSETWDWQTPNNTSLFLGTQDGDLEPQSISGSGQMQDDRWTLQGSLWVFGQRTPLDAEGEAERIFGLFEAWLRTSNRLRGVESGTAEPPFDPDEDGKPPWGANTTVVVGSMSGPWHAWPPKSNPVGRVLFDLICTTTLT